MRFFCGVLLALGLGLTLRADEVKWGEPVNGLRIGIVNAPASATSDQDLTFKVIAENVSKQPITLPTPDTFMPKSNPQSNDYHESPLSPIIERSKIGGSPSQPISEWGISSSGIPSDVAPTTVVTLSPGKSVTWGSIPLTQNFYFGDRLPPGDKTTIKRWTLLPNFLYHLRFRFENQARQLDGHALWIGQADSGIADMEVKAPGIDNFKVQGGFTLTKSTFFVGEPIEVTFTVTNTGTEAIAFPTGSDYRGSGRPDRFSFSATDEEGHAVPDPVSPNGMGGGLGSNSRIEPGGSYTEKLFVNKWCAFTKPGKYKLVCKRVLNVLPARSPGALPHFQPEGVLPTIPIETTLDLTLEDNPAAQAALISYEVNLLLGNIPANNGALNGLASEHLKSLAQAKMPAAFPEIVRLLDGFGEVQQQAVQWLSCYGYEKASPVLLEQAPKLSPRARMLALRILSDWNTPGVEPLVAAALRDPDLELRANTVLICSNHWYAACVPILLTMETDIDPHVRRYLGAALGASSDPRAIPKLIKLLHDYDPDPYIKIWAAQGLGKFKRYEGVPVMIALLNDPKAQDAEGNVMDVLGELTGQNFGENRNAWLEWWEKTGKAQYGKGN